MNKEIASSTTTARLGFVFPSTREAAPLLDDLATKRETNWSGRSVYEGSLRSLPTTVIISGCGKIRTAAATQLLIGRFEPTHLIHGGSGGALSLELSIGDLVIATRVVEHDFYQHFGQREADPATDVHERATQRLRDHARGSGVPASVGVVASGNEDIVTTARRNELFEAYGALSVDWESAAFLEVAHLAGVPACVVRVITDFAYERTGHEFETNLDVCCAKLAQFLVSAVRDNVIPW